MKKLRLILGVVFLGILSFSSYGFSEIKVGIYERSAGARGIAQALKKESGLEIEMIKTVSLTPEQLFKYDVLVIGSLKGIEITSAEAIKCYVNCGGGILLNHDACGYRGWKEPLFPDICKGVGRINKTILIPLFKTKSPLLKGIPKEYTHAYYDHILLEKGHQGEVVVKDEENNPVVIVAKFNYGKVVANGAITGYYFEDGTSYEGEKPPTGGELKLLLNAVSWLGKMTVTSIPKEELAQRRKKAGSELLLTKAKKFLPTSDWFSENMLRGSYLVRQPVNELEGRFLLSCDEWSLGRFAGDDRMRINLRQLKWLGITDIEYNCDLHGNHIYHTTDLPQRFPGIFRGRSKYKTYDPLMSLVRIAKEEGIKVWAGLHPSGRMPDNMSAHDKEGKKYVYGSYGCIVDVLSPAYRKLLHSLIDEYADKYNKYGNFEGIYYDELFFNSVDFHGDDIPLFDKFCKERFGESLPSDIDTKLAKKTKWVEPKDKWWRRYILFKNYVNTDFIKDLTDYCHKKGLKIIVELRPTTAYPTGWSWGLDNAALTHLGADYYLVAGSDSCEPCYVYPNAFVVRFCRGHRGYSNTLCLRGHSLSFYCYLNGLWQLLTFGNNPYLLRDLQYSVRTAREWANSENLARVSILHNQNNLLMRLETPKNETLKEEKLLKKLSYHLDADRMLIEAREFYANYPLLIAPKYSVSGLSREIYSSLKEYIKKGGIVISLDAAKFSTSRADLTKEKDLTKEFVGVRYEDRKSIDIAKRVKFNNNTYPDIKLKALLTKVTRIINPGMRVIATFKGTGEPAITELKIGKGKVIAFHYDVSDTISREKSDTFDYLLSLIKAYSSPEIATKGDLKIVTTLKKNNWVAVSLFGENFPVKGTVSIDLKALGINKKGYRVLMLGKQMEIKRPGDFWGKKGFWTAEEIKQGIPVTIVVNNDENLPLPEKFDLSAYEKKDGSYMNRIMRRWWDSQGVYKRHYEHEILVIAPFDELTIGGK